MKKKVITISILESQIPKIKAEQAKTGCSMSEIIRRALNEFLGSYQNTAMRQDYERRNNKT